MSGMSISAANSGNMSGMLGSIGEYYLNTARKTVLLTAIPSIFVTLARLGTPRLDVKPTTANVLAFAADLLGLISASYYAYDYNDIKGCSTSEYCEKHECKHRKSDKSAINLSAWFSFFIAGGDTLIRAGQLWLPLKKA